MAGGGRRVTLRSIPSPYELWAYLVMIGVACALAKNTFAGRGFVFRFFAMTSMISMTKPKLLCVYCASSTNLDAKYYAAAGEVGRCMVRAGWGLIYGGGNAGLMGSVGRAVKAAGGRVVGVIPDFMIKRELAFREADELVVVKTMRERKRIMDERADAFLALPGGIGTLEELSEVLTERYLNLHQKPVVLFNQDGFYGELLRFFERMVAEKFKTAGIGKLFQVADTVEEICPLLARAPEFEADEIWKTGENPRAAGAPVTR